MPDPAPNAPFRRIAAVRGVSKLLIVAVAGVLLAAGIVACGGGGESSPSTTEAASQGQASGDTSSNAKTAKSGGDEGSGSGTGKSGDTGGSSSGSGGEGESSGKSASDFVPKHHNDSGGGSAQYRVKGGDNSVQEYGEEADTSELDAAGAALHNFLDARAEGNWAAACQYMSKSVTEGFEKLVAQSKRIEDKSCAGILEKLINPAAKASMQAEAAEADVRSLRIEGDRSFVIYTSIEKTILAMPVVNEDGAWKVSSLAGTPLN